MKKLTLSIFAFIILFLVIGIILAFISRVMGIEYNFIFIIIHIILVTIFSVLVDKKIKLN